MEQNTSAGPVRFAVLAADTVLFTLHEGKLLVRLMNVDRPPFFSDIAGLPGGLLHPKETAEETALRIVRTKSAIDSARVYMEQLHTFSDVRRDPRGRVVAVAYMALVPWERLSPDEQSDTKSVWWSPISKAKKLAYDHDEVLACALKRLRSRITYTTLLSTLMPKDFTLTELENTYEHILGTELDKRNFRKKILKLKMVKPTKGKRAGGRFRPAQLYCFVSSDVNEMKIL